MELKKNIIQERAFKFSLNIINLYKVLKKNNEYSIGNQILRSVTSIGANVEEAIAAQSKKDFLSKIRISLKEARETRYWLRLLDESKLIDCDYSEFLKEIFEIISILSKIVKTTSEAFIFHLKFIILHSRSETE